MNGATVWSRGTIESDVFYYKPDKWFKIWFFIVNKVNYSDSKLFKRGECLITYSEIMSVVKCSKTVVHKCIKWMKADNMIETRKTTRGMIITVKRYDDYQSLDNYKTTVETTQRQLRDNSKATTICKKDKNVNKVKKKRNKRLPIQKDFDEINIQSIMIDYGVPEAFVVSEWDSLMNYCHAHNRGYVDFNRALRNFVKRSAIKIKQEHSNANSKAGIDATSVV